MKIFSCLFFLILAAVTLFVSTQTTAAQVAGKGTPEQLKALYDSHQADFDYLLGDWQFTAMSKQWGNVQGFWSAVRLAEGAQVLDEFRVVSPDGSETWNASSTLRSYNSTLDQWELVTVEQGTGLQNIGTAHRVGDEIHIEQKFGGISDKPSILRIRYYNIKADSFSWTADRSVDGGKTWVKNSYQIEAHRIGPPRVLGPLAPARKPAVADR
jgi:hypothetical protein